jgi:hypothetical protein
MLTSPDSLVSRYLWTGTIQAFSGGGGWNGGCHSAHYTSGSGACVLYATGETAYNMDYSGTSHTTYLELLTYTQPVGTT